MQTGGSSMWRISDICLLIPVVDTRRKKNRRSPYSSVNQHHHLNHFRASPNGPKPTYVAFTTGFLLKSKTQPKVVYRSVSWKAKPRSLCIQALRRRNQADPAFTALRIFANFEKSLILAIYGPNCPKWAEEPFPTHIWISVVAGSISE